MFESVVITLGGVGLFLLGMGVMIEGLKTAAGWTLRSALARAASTRLRGAAWGAGVTLLVQSSSATTVTTIGLVGSGLLTFHQAMGVVLGANVGTTGTAWLIALFGVKFSLDSVALPLILAGALGRLFGRGRWSGVGSGIAGLGLILLGLTTLQEGMGGVAEMIEPGDLPGVIGGEGVGMVDGIVGLVALVLAGAVMTTAMQSSSAAIAITLSAMQAGAIGIEQGLALVIGQNVGTTTSAVLAAIGTTTDGRRTAAAHVVFNLVLAAAAMLLFPLIGRAWVWASGYADGPMLIAAFHTAFKLVGVAMVLPMLGWFGRLIEWLVRDGGAGYTRTLDRSVLGLPEVAVEASRRAVASVLSGVAGSVSETLEDADGDSSGRRPVEAPRRRVMRSRDLEEAEQALEQTRVFLSGVAEPPSGDRERARMSSAVHALDHTARLLETLKEEPGFRIIDEGDDDARARSLCVEAMGLAAAIGGRVAHPDDEDAGDGEVAGDGAESGVRGSTERSDRLTEVARELGEVRRRHRRATLRGAGSGEIRAVDAMVRVDTVRRLDRIAYHAWRAASHLLGIAEEEGPGDRGHEDDVSVGSGGSGGARGDGGGDAGSADGIER
ncbi:MAG: Na/Pi cotransporter family protein [Phycisphaerales bacterium]